MTSLDRPRSTALTKKPRNKNPPQKKTSILRQGPTCRCAPWRRTQFRLRSVNPELAPRRSRPRLLCRCGVRRAEARSVQISMCAGVIRTSSSVRGLGLLTPGQEESRRDGTTSCSQLPPLLHSDFHVRARLHHLLRGLAQKKRGKHVRERGWASREVFHPGTHTQLIGEGRGGRAAWDRPRTPSEEASSQSGLGRRKRSDQSLFFVLPWIVREKKKKCLFLQPRLVFFALRGEGRPVPACSGCLRLARRPEKGG